MDLKARCRQIAVELNQTEAWGLPPEALDDLSQRVLPFVAPESSSAELTQVIRNYFYDGPQVEVMAQLGHPEGERCWEAIRAWFVQQAARYGVDSLDVEDVAQEAWRKAREKLGSFAFRSRLRTWLRRIILYTCLDWRRSRREEIAPLPLDPLEAVTLKEFADSQAMSPEEAILQEERALLLELTLRRLLSYRDVQILRYTFLEPYGIERIGDVTRAFRWTDERIAQQVGLAPSSVSTIRKRILERLKSDPEWARLIEEIFGPDWLSRPDQ